MKKSALVAKTAMLLLAVAGVSCSSDNAPAAPAKKDGAKETATKEATINIRYVDGDSIAANYNLAKDLSELQIRAMNKIESAQRSKAAEIQKFAASIEQKARSNGYLSEASYNGDMQKLQKMQQDAEAYMASLQRNAQQDLGQQQIQLNDSIESFIKIYNAKKGYDAIILRSAGLYFNPALDITDEVVAGLNARYNKVADK